MNKVVLVGRLSRDLEVKDLNNDNKVLKNAIAVKRKMAKDKTDFINITAFGKTAELIAKFFSKGDMIAISGSIQVNDNGKDGTDKKVFTDIVVEDFSFTGGRSEKKNDDVF